MIKLLEGMRVVELASYMMGPIAGRVLGEWGAEVIKIEPALKQSMNPADGDGAQQRNRRLPRRGSGAEPICPAGTGGK